MNPAPSLTAPDPIDARPDRAPAAKPVATPSPFIVLVAKVTDLPNLPMLTAPAPPTPAPPPPLPIEFISRNVSKIFCIVASSAALSNLTSASPI